MNTGLIIKPIESDHFVFGDAKLGDSPILTDGDWSQWLPVPENQNVAIEPMCCTTFALLNCVETMLRQKYGAIDNFSDKFLAYVSNTTKFGNDPHNVAESLRKFGDVDEADYPYTSADNTWEKFYSAPAKWLYTKALEFIAQYSFGHSWVGIVRPTQQQMMDALNYSPLSAGVYAWQLDPTTGYYIRPEGAASEHDVMIYGYDRNNYWKIFDSYDQNCKKLAWDFGFDAVKRYTLDRQIVNPSAWDKFLGFMQTILDGMRAQLGMFGDREFGVARSPQWEADSRAFRKANPLCAMGMHKPTLLNPLNTHHVLSFHDHQSEELNPANWINLCRFHHLWDGHLGSWKSTNATIREDAKLFTEKVNTRP